MIKIIVAYDQDRGIAKAGQIPWYYPSDMQFFKQITLGNSIIMGRKTWESLPRKPLPGRFNIILTRNIDNFSTINYVLAKNIVDAIGKAAIWNANKDIYIIGGRMVYKEFLDKNLVNTVVATEIKSRYKCDMYFPCLSDQWQSKIILISNEYNIIEYTRI
jgi:dihydrofolate reductase